MLLVLDLDETLIYSNEETIGREADFHDEYATYHRPGVHDFLEGCFEHFPEVAVWTAAARDYAEPILQDLGVLDRFAFVWCRERCTRYVQRDYSPWSYSGSQDVLLKPIHKLRRKGYDRSRIIYVDDTPEALMRSYGNLVRVQAWNGSQGDTELQDLLPYLVWLKDAGDVRMIDKRSWRHQRICQSPPESLCTDTDPV